jgi:hypothetical protein
MNDEQMIWESYVLKESLDNPYKFKDTFKTEEVTEENEDDGEEYTKEVFSPVQMIHFQTDEGIPYIWYARQNRYDDTTWEIAFGINKGQTIRGGTELDTKLTNTGNAFRVFSTIIEIINRFVDLDENYEIQRLILTSDQPNRTNLYVNRLLPRIDNFEVTDVRKLHGEDEITLERNRY